jgi:DNA-binding IclR family transcriptional regulator
MESADSTGADGTSTDTTDFVGLLDQKGSVKLLDVFLNKETIPVTAADLAEMSGMDVSTVYRRVEDLCEAGLVEESEDSNPTLYRLNVDHPAVTGLTEAHGHLYAHLDEIQSASEQFDPESELFHEGSPFVELFRYPTNVQMLAALLRNPEAELSAAELARAADVDRATVGDNVDVLVEVGLAEKLDPEYATGTRYALNREHPAAEGFQRAAEALARGRN